MTPDPESTPVARTGGDQPGQEETFPASVGGVSVLVITALAVLSQLYAAIPLLVPVGTALGGSATFALSTAYGLCYALGFLLWGPIADRYGRRRVMITGLACLVVTTFGCGLASSLPLLAVLRGAQGLMASSLPPVGLAYLSEAVTPKHRATAIGAMSTAFLVAGIVGQIGAQAVAERFGWSWVFFGSACLLALCMLSIALLVREPGRAPSPGGLGQQFLTIVQLFSRGDVLFLCAAHLTLLLSFVAMYTGLGMHLTALGHDPGTVFALRLAGLPGMFVALAAGPLTRRLGGSTGLTRTGFLVAGLGLVAEALAPESMIGLGLASLVFVTGIALAVPAMIARFGQAAAPRRGSGMAINGFVLFIGASLGPVLATAGLSFTILLLVIALLLGIAAVFVTLSARAAASATAKRPKEP